MKIGVELEFFICHKSDETFYMPDIISRYLKYNSGFISMQKDSNGICIKAKNELGVTISFEFTYSIIEFSIDPQYDILSLHSIISKRLLNYILCIRFFIEVHSIVSASRFFHMPTYLRVVIECQSRFFPFFPAFSRNCPDYFLHTSGSSSFRSLSDLGAR